ncbi:MAG: polysaccharide pyruvyl transferase family protein [Planctomycetota bacterium]
MPNRKPRVAILNCVALNTGDAAILYVLVQQLKEVYGDTVEIQIIDAKASESQGFYRELGIFYDDPYNSSMSDHPKLYRLVFGIHCIGLACVSQMPKGLARRFITWLNPRLKPIVDADVVVATGGTYLVEYYDLLPRFYSLMTSILFGKPLILFTQSLGPFEKLLNRWMIRFCFNRCSHMFLRDERSRRHLKAIGVCDRITVCSDAAFDLPAKPASNNSDANGRGPKVAVSVREWKKFDNVSSDLGMERYLDAMKSTVEVLVRECAARITFISTCQGAAGYSMRDDRVADRVVQMLSEDVRASVQVDRLFRTPLQFVDAMRDFDFVIATRMHMAIMSMVAGTPVHAIAYEFKTVELFDNLGLGEATTPINEADAQVLMNRVRDTLDKRDHIRDIITKQMPDLRTSARMPLEIFREAALSLGFPVDGSAQQNHGSR